MAWLVICQNNWYLAHSQKVLLVTKKLAISDLWLELFGGLFLIFSRSYLVLSIYIYVAFLLSVLTAVVSRGSTSVTQK